MSEQGRFSDSRILDAVHETARDLHEAGFISKRRMKEYDVLCLVPGGQEKTVKQSRFPEGWDEQRVRQVLAHYEEQTEEEAVAEDEAAFRTAST